MIRLLAVVMLVASTIFIADVSVGQTADQPSVVKAVAPSMYPPVAKAARVEGKIIVEVKINEAGDVTSAKALGNQKLLHKVSELAALRWKFVSGAKDRTARLTFSFILGDSDTDAISFIPPYEVEYVGRVPRIQ